MGQIFLGILVVTPLAALVLFFSLEGKQEIKHEQRLQNATQALESKKFDDEFSDAWNGKPTKEVRKQRAEAVAVLNAEVATAKGKRDELDKVFDDAAADMKDTISEENDRLKKIAAKAKENAKGVEE